MFDLINILPIVENHYSYMWGEDIPLHWTITDFIITLGIPFAAASLVQLFAPKNLLVKGDFVQEFVKVIIPVLAILVGFSINAAIMLTGNSKNEFEDENEAEAVEHTRGNTLYALLLGLIALFWAVITILVSEINLPPRPFISLLTFFLTHYFITLMMIARRLFILVEGGALNQ